jgi:hypothetical protein
MALYMADLRQTSGEHYGYILAWSGVIASINLALLVPRLWKKVCTYSQCLIILHTVGILWYVAMAYTGSDVLFCSIFYVTVLGTGIYNPIYNVQIMSHAKPQEIGEISGMMWGLQSLMMFVWPLLAWILLHYQINIFIGATVCFVMSLVVMRRSIHI